MSTGISKKVSDSIQKDDEDHKFYKKGVHFNIANVEDKIIIDYLLANNTNFSALAKQLMLQFINEQVLTVSKVQKIARKEIDDIFNEKIIDEAFQNQIRKIVIESMGSYNIASSSKVPDTTSNEEILTVKSEKELPAAKSEKELIIDKAVSSYTEDDLNAMNFSGGRD